MSDAERKRRKRADERDLRISRVAEPNRRIDCLGDIYQFLLTYFPDVFYQPFTTSRRQMIDAILHVAKYGGDQAIAGPRGDGKTRSALFVALAMSLAGFVQFPIIISKSGPRANRELKNLKFAILQSKLLAEDFPEVVEPILALGRWSSRARQQTAFGEYTDLEWGEDCIVLPTISASVLRENGWSRDIPHASRGQIIASLGIEGPIRGYTVRSYRPGLAIIDDIDDRESARSELQTSERDRILEEDVGGLAGPDRTISRIMLCTLINPTCVAATYTDRLKKPSFKGQRHKLLETLPDRMDLWEEYINLRNNRALDDPDARVAHAFYLEHREAMEAGAVLTNPYRFDTRLLEDGQQSEVSALQACFNIISDRGWGHFNTEYNNDPPEEDAPIESGITAYRVQRQVSGYPKGVVPPNCIVVTQGIDVKKTALHWVVRAWMADGTGYVIDYGVHDTRGTVYGVEDTAVDIAVRRAILERIEATVATEYKTIDGQPLPVQLTLIDARYRTDAVFAACLECKIGVHPVMGFGKSSGCVRSAFTPYQRATATEKPGDNWNLKRNGRIWVVHANADHWKAWEHDRWMTDPAKPGCLKLFGEGSNDKRLSFDEQGHHAYSRHITAEVEVEEIVKGVLKRSWRPRPGRAQNHYLDASYYSDVAASILGVRLPMAQAAKPSRNLPGIGAPRPAPSERPSARDLRGRSN